MDLWSPYSSILIQLTPPFYLEIQPLDILLNAPSSSSSSLNIHDLDTDSSETESDTEFLVGSIVSSVAQAAQSSKYYQA